MDAEHAITAALRAHRRALPRSYAEERARFWRDGSRPTLTWRPWKVTAPPAMAETEVQLRLVWADALLQRGDPRGEQLVLEHLVERAPCEHWEDEARRLLQLVSQRGFVRLPGDEVDESLLGWEGGGTHPVQYWADYGGHSYYVRYRSAHLSIERDDEADIYYPALVAEDGNDWSDSEANLFLHLISDAIRDDRLAELTFPPLDERARDERHRPGPYPRYHAPPDRLIGARDLGRYWAIARRLTSPAR